MDFLSSSHDVSQPLLLPSANVTNPANFGVEAGLRTLFRRCVECPTVDPTCPPCSSSESCVQVAGGCTSCAQNICVPSDQSGGTVNSQSSSSSQPNVGAIVGGVIGGIAAIAIVTFLIWWFCIRAKRDDYEEEKEPYVQAPSTSGYTPSSEAARRASVRSVASTVMTRASNVIQIAFIPGITDRAGHEDEDIPPVPQIPHEQLSPSNYSSPATPYSGNNVTSPAMSPYRDMSPAPSARSELEAPQDHYFTAADLQHSRYSQFSDETDTLADGRSTRYRSVASLTPSLARSSVASAMPQDHPPMPAQMITRGRANVVSVKGSQSTPPSAATVPEVPSVDYFKYGDAKNAAKAAKQAPSVSASEIDEDADSVSELTRPSKVAAAIEEATRRASARPTHGGLGSLNGRSGRENSPLGRPNTARDASPMSRRQVSRTASPMSPATNTRSASPMSRPGTGRDASPFGDQHAATPP